MPSFYVGASQKVINYLLCLSLIHTMLEARKKGTMPKYKGGDKKTSVFIMCARYDIYYASIGIDWIKSEEINDIAGR